MGLVLSGPQARIQVSSTGGSSEGYATVVTLNPQPAGLSYETVLLLGQEPSVCAKVNGASKRSVLSSMLSPDKRDDSMALEKVASCV